MNETDSEDELENTVPVTMRPPCNSDSLLHKKKHRLNAWVSDPSRADKELHNVKRATKALRGELERILEETERWCHAFEIGRTGLTQSIVASRAEAQKLERDAKLLQGLAASECGGSPKKKRTITVREAAIELHERKALLEQKLAEYVKLCKETKGDKVPVVTVEIDDVSGRDLMQLPEDRDAFKKLHGLTDYREQHVAAAVAAASHAAAAQVKNADVSTATTNATTTTTTTTTTDSTATAATEGTSRVVSPMPGDADPGLPKVDMTYSLEIERGGELLSEETQAQRACDAATDTTSGKRGDTSGASESTEREGAAKGTNGRGSKGKAGDDRSSKRVAKGDKKKEEKEKEEEREKEDEDAEIRAVVDSMTAIQEAITTAHNQIGEVDVFFDNLDADGFPPGTNLPQVPGWDAVKQGPSAVDRGSDPTVVQDCLNGSKGLVEDDSTRGPRAEMFRAKYAQGERGWARYVQEQVADQAGPHRKRRRMPTSISVKSYAYARTPRGVPLMVSPLSQYEDKFAGSVVGGPSASNLYNGTIPPHRNASLPRAVNNTPAFLIDEENRVMTHALLQSASASSATKLRRLRTMLADWKRQEADSQALHERALLNNEGALREDVIECKRIRRELQAFGIASTPLNPNTPLSPIAETSGWGITPGYSDGVGSGPNGGPGISHLSDKEKKRASKNFGMGRGRSSGSMAALQKGNNRKSKHEWRGPPRNPKEAAAAAAAQAAAAERILPRDGPSKGKGQRDRADGKDAADEGEDEEGGEGAGDGEGKEGMDVE